MQNKAIYIFKRYSIDEVQRIMEESREVGEHQEVLLLNALFKIFFRNYRAYFINRAIKEISKILANNLTGEDLDEVEIEYEQMIHQQLPTVPDEQIGKDQQPEVTVSGRLKGI